MRSSAHPLSTARSAAYKVLATGDSPAILIGQIRAVASRLQLGSLRGMFRNQRVYAARRVPGRETIAVRFFTTSMRQPSIVVKIPAGFAEGGLRYRLIQGGRLGR